MTEPRGGPGTVVSGGGRLAALAAGHAGPVDDGDRERRFPRGEE